MNNAPESLYGVFKRNPERRGLFDLSPKFQFPFPYVVLSESKSNYLKKVGAEMVLDCWGETRQKVLHTGLIGCSFPGWYFGDNLHESEPGKKDFLIIQIARGKIGVYLFPNWQPEKGGFKAFTESFIMGKYRPARNEKR
jgi:hypothetical protein